MNVLEIINRAKELYKKLSDPLLTPWAKMIAFIDFAIFVRQIFADAPAGFQASGPSPATAEAALADLEALAAGGEEGLSKIGDGILAKKLLDLLIKFLPMILTIL